MRQMQCTLPEGGNINISAGEYRRSIVGGDVVDLDQVLVKAVPATKDAPARGAVTLEEALGHHVEECFEPVTADTPADVVDVQGEE